jgi:hypothetical protein
MSILKILGEKMAKKKKPSKLKQRDGNILKNIKGEINLKTKYIKSKKLYNRKDKKWKTCYLSSSSGFKWQVFPFPVIWNYGGAERYNLQKLLENSNNKNI